MQKITYPWILKDCAYSVLDNGKDQKLECLVVFHKLN